MGKQLRYELIVDDKGSVKVKRFGSEATDASDRAKRSFTGLNSTLGKATAALAGFFAVGQMKAWATDWVRAAGVQEKATAGMVQAMRSMGRYSPELKARLMANADALQAVTTFGDEATESGTKFLLTYKAITDDLLPRSQRVMLDLAALMGGDTKMAANMLGKASMGLSGELRRVGITIDEDIAKGGDFAQILGEIEKQVGGQARAMAATGYGGLEQMANLWGDTKEDLGELVIEVTRNLLPTLKSWAGALSEIATYWGQVIKGPDAAGMLKKQRTAISKELESLVTLKDKGYASDLLKHLFGFDEAELDSRIASLKKQLMTVTTSLQAELKAQSEPGGGKTTAPVVDQKTIDEAKERQAQYWEWIRAGYQEEHDLVVSVQAGIDESAKRYHDQEKARREEEAEQARALAGDRIDAYRAMYDTLRQFGVEDYEFRAALIEQQAAQYEELLAGQQEAEALINEWRRAEMQLLNEEKWEKENTMMNSLRESWGLTWEEIRTGAVDSAAILGEALANASHMAASAVTSIVTGTASASQALKTLGKAILAELVGALIELGMRQLMLAAIGKASLAAQTVATVAAMTAINKAATPAAVNMSIATYGSAAVVGGAAYTAAMLEGMALSYGVNAANMAGGFAAPYAEGGHASAGQLMLVGEEGPELWVPDRGGTVIPNNAISGGGDLNIAITFTGPVKLDADMDDVKRNVGEAVVAAINNEA